MSKELNNYHEHCLFFAANSLSRSINEMTDRAFATTGISASYGHLLLILDEQPGLNQNDLSKLMNVKASTMTRFIDKLEQLGLVERNHEGRTSNVFLTKSGSRMIPMIMDALKRLYKDYCEILGEEFAVKLTKDIHLSNVKLSE